MSNVGILPAGAKRKIFNALVFAFATQQKTLTNMLSGSMGPVGTKGLNKAQSDADHPIVTINDLKSEKGDEVGFEVVHALTGKPTMGDKKLAGRGKALSMGTAKIQVNQGRYMVHDSGAVLKTLSSHNTEAIINKLLEEYYNELCELITLYHIMGARGSYVTYDDKVPLESDPEFLEIMVNEVLAPTFSRHFYAGSNDSIESLDSTDRFSLEIVDNLNLRLKEMKNPLRKIRLEGKDKVKGRSKPFYLMLVSPRQWHDLETSSTTKDWMKMTAQVSKRMEGFNHPILQGDMIVKGDIVVKQMERAVGWRTGDNVKVSKNDADATTELRTVGTDVHRSVLLGAQALGVAYGTNENVKSQFSLNEEETDHKNSKEISMAWVNGKQAIRLPDADGVQHDMGRIVVDTAVKMDA